MSLYAIGDLHLSLASDKPMDVFGGGWNNYIEKIKTGFSLLEPDDVCVLCGDTSWGMSLDECIEDFRFISGLPGKKILLKGNHDYWWETTSKMKAFFSQNSFDNIDILHNNCFFYGGAAICGTRGWQMETESDMEHNAKITARETARLRASLKAAGDAGEKLCFLHYPPRFKGFICPDIVSAMNDFSVKNCWYGHVHGHGHRSAVRGEVEGIVYEMVSADFVDFVPQKIL
ncbi:MAG: metallophosphoesterase [Oscillospiraceae bacterium]|nr:metallophosphoesterase [Oscillospiraceae bacterium]